MFYKIFSGSSRGKRFLSRFIATVGLCLLAAGPVIADSPKVAKDLKSGGGLDLVEVIVQFQTPVAQADLQTLRGAGGAVLRQLDLIKGVHIRVPRKALDVLALIPQVRFVSPDRKIGGSLDYTAAAVQAGPAWTSGWTGAGVGVAIVDSGVVDHPDFANDDCTGSRIVYRESLLPGDPSTLDTYGHGTHVAGIVGGNGRCAASSWVFKGMAPRSNLVVLRALDGTGSGSDSTVIAAIQRAIQLKNTYNIRVLNLSLGRVIWENYALDPLSQAVAQAWNAGIVVV
ncbi:MAG: S8 family serine peptidase, partial [Acidobacteria bacterium]|nr:S8 family serine peptidase [Acidobacteriota bacterium]